MSGIVWKKSSFSGDRDDCVELGLLNGCIVIRESDYPGTIVATSAKRLEVLVKNVKVGTMDRLA
jgi:hypothetical protein